MNTSTHHSIQGGLSCSALPTDTAVLLWATSDLHPSPKQLEITRVGIQSGLRVSVCVFHERTHTQTHISTLLPVIVISLRQRHSGKRRRGIVFVSARVCCMCICVHVMTQYKFNTGAFLCSCHPDTRLRSVGNNESGIERTYNQNCHLSVQTLSSY